MTQGAGGASTGGWERGGGRQRLRQLADLVLVLPAALTQLRGDTGGREGRQQGGGRGVTQGAGGASTGGWERGGGRQRLRQLADLVLVLPAALTQLRGDTGGREGRQQGGGRGATQGAGGASTGGWKRSGVNRGVGEGNRATRITETMNQASKSVKPTQLLRLLANQVVLCIQQLQTLSDDFI